MQMYMSYRKREMQVYAYIKYMDTLNIYFQLNQQVERYLFIAEDTEQVSIDKTQNK